MYYAFFSELKNTFLLLISIPFLLNQATCQILLHLEESFSFFVSGPNGSGKTVYLKEIALITFLAHIGIYVPAEKANIGLVNSIHSRLQTKESASLRLSSFMIDITQVTAIVSAILEIPGFIIKNYFFQTTKALNSASSNSFILMDEFGRATSEEDGIVLLSSVLKYFLNMKKYCPHVIVSTHFQKIVNFLPETSLLEYFKMDFRMQDDEIYFLFKITKGNFKQYEQKC